MPDDFKAFTKMRVDNHLFNKWVQYYDFSLQCYFHVMSYFFITICREGVVYLLCRWLQLEADVSRGVLTFVELNPDENRKNLVSFRFNVAFVTMCSLDFYRGQFHPRWSLLMYSFDK